jgi:hypothetical protein
MIIYWLVAIISIYWPGSHTFLTDNFEITDDDSISVHSDHKAISFDLKLHQRPKQSTERIVYNYSNGDFVGLLNCLRNTPLVDLFAITVPTLILPGPSGKLLFLLLPIVLFRKQRSWSTSRHQHEGVPIRRKAKAKNTPQLWEKFRKTRQHVKCWINAKNWTFSILIQ